MESYHDYDVKEFPFVRLVTELLGTELSKVHELGNEYEFFSKPGPDSSTRYHKMFYDKMREGWPEFCNSYQEFVRNVIAPMVGEKDRLVYQKWPTFRVHLPNNVAVGGWHRDSDYNHPKGEINFIVALTPMFESNSTISEGNPGMMDFRQFVLNPGQFVKFDGNNCIHGNLPNMTGVTRVSFDFRVIPYNEYAQGHVLSSLSTGKKFIIGDYYELMQL